MQDDRDSDGVKAEISRVESRLAALDEERARLVKHLAELKAQSAAPPRKEVSSQSLTSPAKIALFMSLFRGRTDVFPLRWENPRKGSAGYSPACANEWVRGVCNKPRVRCGECQHQAFLPVTESVVQDHLLGRHVMGVYPLLKDETCRLLAVDFDGASWQEDVLAFVRTCREKGVPVAIERSRSGDGAHVWFFFTGPVKASAARRMGCYLLTETMSARHELSMASYDRLFPSQDTMPRGGFGNLIALPFQGGPRLKGNSVFVDESWKPHRDQWAHLASRRRMHPSEVEALADEAARRGRIIGVRMCDPEEESGSPEPWARSPSRRRAPRLRMESLPTRIHAVLAQQLFVESAGLPSPLLSQIKRLAAFQNPEFYRRQALRLSTALTPRVIGCAEDLEKHVALPRACADDLASLLAELGIELEIEDKRESGREFDVSFEGTLTGIQRDAFAALSSHDTGVFVAPPGCGKTVVGIRLVAERKRNTLVLVHRTQLMEQWAAQLALFLSLPPRQIGQIGGGKRKPNGQLDVAMMQSLARREGVDDLVAAYGHVIVDECHHVPAVSFERIMREVRARYVVGLTATPQRRDGHQPILRLQLGPTRFVIDARAQAAERSFRHVLIARKTAFRLKEGSADGGIQDVYRQIARDPDRNRLIIDDVIAALEEGRSPLLLTERRDHLEHFSRELEGVARNLVVLQGGMRTKQRREALQQLRTVPEDEERLVLATGRFIGEGFDDARLDTLFLAMPVSWKGTLVQYSGRLHRAHHGKTEVRVMDYVDEDIPMLARMFERRLRGYRALGYTLGEAGTRELFDDGYAIEYDEVDRGDA